MQHSNQVLKRYANAPRSKGYPYDHLFCGKKCKAKRKQREADTLRSQEQAKAAQAKRIAELKRAEQETAKAQTEQLRMQTASQKAETAQIEKKKAEAGNVLVYVGIGVGLVMLVGGVLIIRKLAANRAAAAAKA